MQDRGAQMCTVRAKNFNHERLMGHSRMSPNMRPSWYEWHVLPYLMDMACGMRPVWHQRDKVVPLATGCILEIGIGTGLNLEHYDKANIEKIVGLDPGLAMLSLARKRVKQAALQWNWLACRPKRFHIKKGVSTQCWSRTRSAPFRTQA
jgi:Methyltransferase domain